VREESILNITRTSGHSAAECSLCPNGTGWAASTVAKKSNPTYLFAIKEKVKLLTAGQTWASANAHVGRA
jgi:hypothetical protein